MSPMTQADRDAVYEKIEADCLALLQKNFIDYTVTHRGFGKDDANWQHDLWLVSITGPNKGRFEFDYRTGTAHRKVPKANLFAYHQSLENHHRSRHAEMFIQWSKPVAPTFSSVFKSVELDAAAANMSFSDWCDDYGYSNDSLSALNIYRTCEDNGRAAHKLFPRPVWDQLCELTQDI